MTKRRQALKQSTNSSLKSSLDSPLARPSNGGAVAIESWWLLGVYAVLPAGLILLALDLVAGGGLLQRLPTDPLELAWFTLLFVLPHIVASFFSFFDAQYLEAYGPKLLRGAQLAVLATFLLPLISVDLAVVSFAVLTMTHVTFQQGGIAKSLMGTHGTWHRIWQWSTAAVASAIYLNIYSLISFNATAVSIGIFFALVFVTLSGYRAAAESKSALGSAYFWLTHATLLVAFGLMLLNYPLLAILIPRAVHDLTAFICYVSHDRNRFADTHSNVIYKTMASLGVPVVLASPLLAFCVASFLQVDAVRAATIPLISVLTFMHYYTESQIWRSGTLHRQYLLFSK